MHNVLGVYVRHAARHVQCQGQRAQGGGATRRHAAHHAGNWGADKARCRCHVAHVSVLRSRSRCHKLVRAWVYTEQSSALRCKWY